MLSNSNYSQLNGFKYCYLTLIILFNTIHSFKIVKLLQTLLRNAVNLTLIMFAHSEM